MWREPAPYHCHKRSFAAISDAAGNTKAKMPTEATRMSVFPKARPLSDDLASRGVTFYTVVRDRAIPRWAGRPDGWGGRVVADS